MQPPAPNVLAPIFENIPDELKPDAVKQWCLWRLEVPYWAKKQGKTDTLAKIPKRIGDTNAKSNDPGTWTRYSAAKDAYGRLCPNNPYSGVGFMLTRAYGVVCVDLDKIRNPETGEILAEAQKYIDALNSYAEVSPSGTGVKIFVRGTLPDDCPCSLKGYFGKGTALELFDDERMVCMTGHRLPSSPETINRSQVGLDVVVKQATYFKAMEQLKRQAGRPKIAMVARDPSTVSEQQRIDWARKYLAKVPPAIEGQGGSNVTMWAARVVVRGFDIDEETAYGVLNEWNQACDPPWCERDLRRKIREAATVDFDHPLGWLLAKRQMPLVGPKAMAWKGPSKTLAAAMVPSECQWTEEADEKGANSSYRFRPDDFSDEDGNEPQLDMESDAAEYDPTAWEDEAPTADEAIPPGKGDDDSTESAKEEEEESDPVLSGKRKETSDEGRTPLGQVDPTSGRVVLHPQKTLPTVDALRREYYRHAHGWTILNQGGIFFVWKGNQYVRVEDDEVKRPIIRFLHEASQYAKDDSGEWVLVQFHANDSSTEKAFKTLKIESCVPSSQPAPAWINKGVGPDPHNLLAFPSGTLDVITGQVYEPTPLLFNCNALDFEYDPSAPPPRKWLATLEQWWPKDEESIRLLQEWFGYCLTGDMRQHKALMILGPTRSGKGIISRLQQRLIGKANCCSPATKDLANEHGTSELVGKTLAILADMRFKGENTHTAVENLLRIIGGDAVTINPKHKAPFTIQLGVRFLVLTNELPKFNDDSNALVNRFLVLKMIQSFLDREDHDLEDHLTAELPGILLWSLEGLKRLRSRGRFVRPKCTDDLMKDFKDNASPLGCFLRDHCQVGDPKDENFRVSIPLIYEQFRRWCADASETAPRRQQFGTKIRSAVAHLEDGQDTDGSRFYKGIRLVNPIQKSCRRCYEHPALRDDSNKCPRCGTEN